MNRIMLCFVVLALGVAGSFARPASAAVLFNNLDEATDSAWAVENYSFLAQSFSTDSSPFLLQDVQLLLSGTQRDLSFTVNLYPTDTSIDPNAPDYSNPSPIATLPDTVLSDTPAIVDISLGSSPISLAPNTRYWIGIVASDTDGGYQPDVNWQVSAQGSGQSGEFVDIAGAVSSTDYNNNDNGSPFAMSVSGASAVPEPTTVIIWSLLGVLGVVGVWRKRKAA